MTANRMAFERMLAQPCERQSPGASMDFGTAAVVARLVGADLNDRPDRRATAGGWPQANGGPRRRRVDRGELLTNAAA